MSMLGQQFPKPLDWQAFERLCFALFAQLWGDPNTKMHGRTGQPQAGVDIYGRDNRGRNTGVQAKGKNEDYGNPLTRAELLAEVAKARAFDRKLEVFVVATTAPDDVHLQALAREITQRHARTGDFEVHVLGWDTLKGRLAEFPAIAREHLSLVGNQTVLDEILGTRASLEEGQGAILAKLEEFTFALRGAVSVNLPPRPSDDVAADRLHTRIKDAAELGNVGQSRAALASLERLRASEWAGASPRNRHRLMNAIAFVRLALDDTTEAVASFRAAYEADPARPWSSAALAFAEMLEGRREIAYAHARRALAEDPSFEQAIVVLLHTAPDDIPMGDLVAGIPAELRAKSQILLALVTAAHGRGDKVGALGWAEEAYSADPSDWRTASTFGQELLRRVVRHEAIGLTKLVPAEDRPTLDRGVALLRRAWTEISSTDLGARLPDIAGNLALGLEVAGEEAEAEATVEAALRLAPAYPPLLRRRAVTEAVSGRWQEVASLVGRIPVAEREPEDDVMGARGLLEDGRPADARRTVERARALSPKGRTKEALEGVDLEAVLALGGGADEIEGSWARYPDSLVIRIAVLDRVKDDDRLRARLLADLDRILPGRDDERDLAMAASILRVLGEHSRAADLLAPLVTPDRDTPLLRDLLRCLAMADRRREARELFESLTPEIRRDPAYLEIGVTIYERVGLLVEARALLAERLRMQPDDLRSRLLWLDLSERMRDLGGALDWLRGVGAGVEGSPRELMALAHAIDRHLADPKCVRIGYRALRLGFADPDMHLAYSIGLFLLGSAIRKRAPHPDAIGPDTVAILSGPDGAERLVRVIETEGDPRIERGEVSPSDDLAKRLMGLKVGDALAIRDFAKGEVPYVVLEIRDKYTHAHFDVLERFPSRFPGSRAFGSLDIGDEDDPDRFADVFRITRERAEHGRDLLERYRAGEIPLAILAKASGCSAIDVWDDLRHDPGTPIRCALGTVEEREGALRALTEAEMVVADPATLHMAVQLGIAETLLASVRCLAVTQTTIDSLVEIAHERRSEVGRGRRGTLLWDGRHYVMRESDSAALEARAKEVERSLAFARRCRLVAAEGATAVSGKLGDFLDLLPEAYRDTLLAASDPGRMMLCEDGLLRFIAANTTGVRGCWLQAALMHGVVKGRIPYAAYADAVGCLAEAGHDFTSFSAHEVIHELSRHMWMPMGRVQAFLRLLARPGGETGSHDAVVADVLVRAWFATRGDWRFRATVSKLLDVFHGARPDEVAANARRWMEGVSKLLQTRARERAFRSRLQLPSTQLTNDMGAVLRPAQALVRRIGAVVVEALGDLERRSAGENPTGVQPGADQPPSGNEA